LTIQDSQFTVNKFLRLGLFALFCAVLAYLSINCGLAWVYAYALTHPGCIRNPPPSAELPPPQEVQLHTSDGVQLRAWYYPSQNGAALVAFDGPRGALGNRLPPLAFLVEAGYGALQIDSRACARPQETPVTLGGDEIYDAKAGVDFLLSQPEVDVVGAYGFSMGGVTVIRAAARYPEIAAVVAEGGYFNLGLDFVEPGRSKPLPEKLLLYTIAGAFWLTSRCNPWELSPVEDLPRISPRPVLLIYGEREIAAGRGRLQFEAARQPKELWVVPDGGHGANHAVATQEYERRVLAFFDRYLLGEE
jgi:dipeptidyl aminopeptidase/acylaminoacyl peptidase